MTDLNDAINTLQHDAILAAQTHDNRQLIKDIEADLKAFSGADRQALVGAASKALQDNHLLPSLQIDDLEVEGGRLAAKSHDGHHYLVPEAAPAKSSSAPNRPEGPNPKAHTDGAQVSVDSTIRFPLSQIAEWKDGNLVRINNEDGSSCRFENGRWYGYTNDNDKHPRVLGNLEIIFPGQNAGDPPVVVGVKGTVTREQLLAEYRKADPAASMEVFSRLYPASYAYGARPGAQPVEQPDTGKTGSPEKSGVKPPTRPQDSAPDQYVPQRWDDARMTAHIKDLHKAIGDAGGDLANDAKRRCVEALCRQIDQLPPDQKSHYRELYKAANNGTSLEDELKQRHLDIASQVVRGQSESVDSAHVSEARQAMDILSQGDNAEASHHLRLALREMNGDEIKQLNSDGQLEAKLKTLGDSGAISPACYQTMVAYFHNPAGSPARQDPNFYANLAHIANTQAGSAGETMDMVREAVGCSNNPNTEKMLGQARMIHHDKYAEDESWRRPGVMLGNNENAEVQAILQYGKATLDTRVTQGTGVLTDNPSAVHRYIQQEMTQAQRDQFVRGKQIDNEIKSGKSRDDLPMNDKFAVDYYHEQCEILMRMAGSCAAVRPRSERMDMHVFEDEIAQGKPTLISKMTEHYDSHWMGLVNGDSSELKTTLAALTEDDYKLIRNDSLYRQELLETIKDLNPGQGQYQQIEDRINKIAHAGTYQEAKAAAQTSIADLKSSDDITTLNALRQLSPHDQFVLKSETEEGEAMRQHVTQLISGIGSVDDRSLAENIYKKVLDSGEHITQVEGLELDAAAVRAGQMSKVDFLQALAKHGLKTNDTNGAVVAEKDAIAAAYREIGQGSPKSELAKRIDQTLRSTVTSKEYQEIILPALKNPDFKLTNTALEKLSMDQKHTCYRGGCTTSEVPNPQAEINNLKLLSSESKENVLGLADAHNLPKLREQFPSLNDAQIECAVAILRNPDAKPSAADELRLYVLKTNSDEHALREHLSGLTADQKKQLLDEYQNKYHQSAIADLYEATPEPLRSNYMELISPDPSSFGRAMQTLDAIENMRHTNGFAQYMRDNWAGDSMQIDQTLFKLMSNDISEADRQKLRGELMSQLVDEQKVSQQVADRFFDIALAAAAIATGGVASPWLAAVAAGTGAVVKPALRMTMQGNGYGDFGNDVGGQLAADAASGFVNTLGAVIGGKPGEAAVSKILEKVSQKAAEGMAAHVEEVVGGKLSAELQAAYARQLDLIAARGTKPTAEELGALSNMLTKSGVPADKAAQIAVDSVAETISKSAATLHVWARRAARYGSDVATEQITNELDMQGSTATKAAVSNEVKRTVPLVAAALRAL